MDSNDKKSENQSNLKKKFIRNLVIWGIILLVVVEYVLIRTYVCPAQTEQTTTESSETTPNGMMILIEYKDTVGLTNFVNELYKRNIHSLLLASPEFVNENCETIKQLTSYNMEIIGSYIEEPFWDMPYDEQYEEIIKIKEEIEACTNQPLEFVGSKYFASDENTVKVAEELGIPYVTARGTTGLAATVYKPEEYDVKILSVSNIERIEFEYGSLCDYSFYERSGTPDDMYQELTNALENSKINPVTHTNIGGFKRQWNDMWIEFFDNNEINWESLEEFMSTDKTLPIWQIPVNKNAPYTPEKIRPLIPYDEEENIDNPCAVEDLPEVESNETDEYDENKLVMFHNGTGPMCLDALEFIETINYSVEQHLTNESDFHTVFEEYKSNFTESEGVSTSFGYYPIIFIKGRAFSGFNTDIESEILELIE